jgi:hypothetical protein
MLRQVEVTPTRRKRRGSTAYLRQVVLPTIAWGEAMCSTGFGELLPMLLALSAEPVPGYRCLEWSAGVPFFVPRLVIELGTSLG